MADGGEDATAPGGLVRTRLARLPADDATRMDGTDDEPPS